jgi:putative MATE family efflux protein
MADTVKRKRLLDGSVLKSLFFISVPVILGNVLQMLYQLIDTFWVGRLGTDAVAAVSLSFPILFFLASLAMGFTMAGSILIAQYNGRGDMEKVAFSTGQTTAFVLIIAITISIVGYFIAEPILSLLTDSESVLTQATSYLKISFLAITAMFMYAIFQSSMRGVGEVKIPMIIIGITVIINFFIDPLFMFGWGIIPAMGVSGVAMATFVTQYLAAIIGIILLVNGRYNIKLRLRDLKINKNWLKKIIKLGLPSSIEHSSRSFGMMIMTFVVSTFGTLAIAAYGIGTRILSFVIIPAIGFSIATATLVGNNLGARQHSRAEKIVKAGMKIGFFTLFAIGVLVFIFAPQITAFFVPGETELIKTSSLFIRIMSLTFGFIGIQMTIFGTLKASGKTTTSMVLAMFHTLTLFIISYILGINAGLNELGIWIAYPAANILALFASLYVYKKKDWLKKEII